MFELDGESENQSFDPQKEWVGMPEFISEDRKPIQKIIVNFESREDVERFAQLTGQRLTTKTDSMWFPPKPFDKVKLRRYVDESAIPSLRHKQREVAEPDDCQGSGEDGR